MALKLVRPERWVAWSVSSSTHQLAFLTLLWVFSTPSPRLPRKLGSSDP